MQNIAVTQLCCDEKCREKNVRRDLSVSQRDSVKAVASSFGSMTFGFKICQQRGDTNGKEPNGTVSVCVC